MPVYPGAQRQRYCPFTDSHVAPFWHGRIRHGSTTAVDMSGIIDVFGVAASSLLLGVVIISKLGDDLVTSTPGDDIVTSNPGDDIVTSKPGDVIVTSKSGDDMVTATSPYDGVDAVRFSGISNPQQHDWSLGRSCPIRSRTVESVPISTLGVTGGIVGGGGSVTTVVLFTVGDGGGVSNGGFVPISAGLAGRYLLQP